MKILLLKNDDFCDSHGGLLGGPSADGTGLIQAARRREKGLIALLLAAQSMAGVDGSAELLTRLTACRASLPGVLRLAQLFSQKPSLVTPGVITELQKLAEIDRSSRPRRAASIRCLARPPSSSRFGRGQSLPSFVRERQARAERGWIARSQWPRPRWLKGTQTLHDSLWLRSFQRSHLPRCRCQLWSRLPRRQRLRSTAK